MDRLLGRKITSWTLCRILKREKKPKPDIQNQLKCKDLSSESKVCYNFVKRMVLNVLAKSFPAQSKHEMSRLE